MTNFAHYNNYFNNEGIFSPLQNKYQTFYTLKYDCMKSK